MAGSYFKVGQLIQKVGERQAFLVLKVVKPSTAMWDEFAYEILLGEKIVWVGLSNFDAHLHYEVLSYGK